MHQFITRTLSLVVAVAFLAVSSAAAAPIPPEDLDILDRDSTWYTTESLASCGGGSTANVDFNGGENAKIAFQYFIGRGLTPNQSAGIVGNLQAESGVDPGIQEFTPISGRGGFGIAQWTGGRRVALESYAALNNEKLDSLQFQLDYLWDQELMKGYKTSVLDPIKASSTIRQASDIILHDFEKPADQSVKVEEYRASLGQKVFDLYAAESGNIVPAVEGALSCEGSIGDTVAGFVGFPLKTTKARMAQLNGSCLRAPKMCLGGHPYAAHDIMADPATPTLSILDGEVISISQDKCPGRLISIYSAAQDVTVSYLHLSISRTVVKDGDKVTAGQLIGYVGSGAEGCGSAHLHIDAASGQPRPGCRRENCPVANQGRFIEGSNRINLAVSLYETYMKLP